MDAILLTQIQISQRLSAPAGGSWEHHIGQMEVARQQPSGILGLSFAAILGLHLTRAEVLKEGTLYQDGLLLKLARHHHQDDSQYRDAHQQAHRHLQHTAYHKHDKGGSYQHTQHHGSH